MGCIEKRYLITFLSFLGFAFMMLLQLLTQARTLQWIYNEHGEINYSAILYVIINVIFYIGQMTSLFGGIIGNRYGGAVIFGIAMLLCALISFLLELLLRVNLILFMIVKFFDGAIKGLIYSSIADVWSRWTTLQHRSKYVSFTLAGCHLAEIIQIMFFQQKNNPLEFVAIGAVIWAIVWLLFVKNDPSQDGNLSNTEKIILQERLKFLDEKSVALSQYPWLLILKSKSFWALNAAALVKGGGNLIVLQILQNSLLYHLGGNVLSLYKKLLFIMNSLIFILTIILGWIVDYIRNKNIVTKNKLKLFVCVSFVAQSIILIATYSSYDYPAVLLLLFVLGLIFRTSAEISIQTTVIDLSPRYASLLTGIENSFSVFGLSCLHLLVIFTPNLVDIYHLSPFIIAFAALYIMVGLLYYIFGSTQLQSWNGTSKDGQELEEHKNRMMVGE